MRCSPPPPQLACIASCNRSKSALAPLYSSSKFNELVLVLRMMKKPTKFPAEMAYAHTIDFCRSCARMLCQQRIELNHAARVAGAPSPLAFDDKNGLINPADSPFIAASSTLGVLYVPRPGHKGGAGQAGSFINPGSRGR